MWSLTDARTQRKAGGVSNSRFPARTTTPQRGQRLLRWGCPTPTRTRGWPPGDRRLRTSSEHVDPGRQHPPRSSPRPHLHSPGCPGRAAGVRRHPQTGRPSRGSTVTSGLDPVHRHRSMERKKGHRGTSHRRADDLECGARCREASACSQMRAGSGADPDSSRAALEVPTRPTARKVPVPGVGWASASPRGRYHRRTHDHELVAKRRASSRSGWGCRLGPQILAVE